MKDFSELYNKGKNAFLFEDFQIKGNWFVSDENKKCNGILEYVDGEISLELFGNLSEPNVSYSDSIFQNFHDLATFQRTYGKSFKIITLLNVYPSHRNNAGIVLTTYNSYEMFIGDWRIEESNKVKTIYFSYPFIWGPFHNRQEEHHREINKEIKIDDFVTLKIGQTSSSSHSLQESKTFQKEFFQIDWKTPVALNESRNYQTSINHFMRLCFGTPIYPEHYSLTTNFITGDELRPPYYYYFPGWTSFIKNTIKRFPKPHDGGFLRYSDIDDFERVIQKWMELWFKTQDVMFDFFNIFESRTSLETKFTELCHVIQKFYVEVNNDDLNFRVKVEWFLNQCIDEIKNKINTDNFLSKVVDTRDYNVHGNNSRTHLVTNSQGLYTLTDGLTTLIEIFLIKQLGIEKDSIQQKYYKKNISNLISFNTLD